MARGLLEVSLTLGLGGLDSVMTDLGRKQACHPFGTPSAPKPATCGASGFTPRSPLRGWQRERCEVGRVNHRDPE